MKLRNPSTPWSGAVARVNIPDSYHQGYRIVGYRVPENEAGMSEAIFKLSDRDREYESMKPIFHKKDQSVNQLYDVYRDDNSEFVLRCDPTVLGAVLNLPKEAIRRMEHETTNGLACTISCNSRAPFTATNAHSVNVIKVW